MRCYLNKFHAIHRLHIYIYSSFIATLRHSRDINICPPFQVFNYSHRATKPIGRENSPLHLNGYRGLVLERLGPLFCSKPSRLIVFDFTVSLYRRLPAHPNSLMKVTDVPLKWLPLQPAACLAIRATSLEPHLYLARPTPSVGPLEHEK